MRRDVVDQGGDAGCTGPLRRFAASHVDPNCQLLTQLDTVLVERIYAPNRALDENAVLVQCQNSTKSPCSGLRIHEQRTRSIALVNSMDTGPSDLALADAAFAHVRFYFRQGVSIGKRL